MGLLDVNSRYLIVGPTRSGTTALHLLLAGHPEVSVLAGELNFKQLAVGAKAFTVKGYVTDDEERLSRAAIFDALTGAVHDSNTKALGAKTTTNNDVAAAHLSATLRQHLGSVKVIVLVRRDFVAHFYSRVQLRKTGIAHSWQRGEKTSTDEPARLNKWLLAKHVIANVDLYRELAKIGTFADYIEVEYEQFEKDNLSTYRDLLTFLGLGYREPVWHQSEKLHKNPATSIADYQALTDFANEIAEKQRTGTLSPTLKTWVRAYSRCRQSLVRTRLLRSR